MASTGKARADTHRQQRHAAAFSFLTNISLQAGAAVARRDSWGPLSSSPSSAATPSPLDFVGTPFGTSPGVPSSLPSTEGDLSSSSTKRPLVFGASIGRTPSATAAEVLRLPSDGGSAAAATGTPLGALVLAPSSGAVRDATVPLGDASDTLVSPRNSGLDFDRAGELSWRERDIRSSGADSPRHRPSLPGAGERSSSPVAHLLRSKENLVLERHSSLSLAAEDTNASTNANPARATVRLASMSRLAAAVAAGSSVAPGLATLLSSRLYFAGWSARAGDTPERANGAPSSASAATLSASPLSSLAPPAPPTPTPSTPGGMPADATFGSQVSSWGLAHIAHPYLGESLAVNRAGAVVASAPVWVCSFLPYRSASHMPRKGEAAGEAAGGAAGDATAAVTSSQPLLLAAAASGVAAMITSGKSKVRAVSYRHLLDASPPGDTAEEEGEGPAARVAAYDPHMLDDPELRSGKHRTVITLPSLTVSIIQYVRPGDLKRNLNEQFRERHPTINLTFSKMRSLKNQMLSIGVTDSQLELSTVAKSYVYFEKLILKGVVTKDNRKEVAAACLLLATKFNDQLCYELDSLFASVERVFGVSKKELLAYEFPVYVALEFALHIDPSVVFPHLDRLFHSLPDYAERLFTVQVQQKKDPLGATESSDDNMEED